MAGLLEKAGDADSKGPQEVPSLISVFHHVIRLSHLYLEFYVHCVVIINDGLMG